ncbi:MAG: hypothetical protein ACK4V2_04470 [Pseudomonadota bacterium]|jgi:hypothetical protein|nr:hypothetical protein [Alphaproteobacteria bacterium]
MFKKWFTFFTICCATTQIHGAERLDEGAQTETRIRRLESSGNIYISDITWGRFSFSSEATHHGITNFRAPSSSRATNVNASDAESRGLDSAQP